MFQRYLILGPVPELRPDPIQSDKGSNELEVVIPVDVYWKIQDLVKEIRYARVKGDSTQRQWAKFAKLIYPCIIMEKDRAWFKRYIDS